MRIPMFLAGIVCALLAPPSAAQSINIDFGTNGSGPPSTYAGADLPGVWNSITVNHTSANTGPQAFDIPLVDIHGDPTGAGIHQFGGQDQIDVADPVLTGDHHGLLDDGLVTHSTGLETGIYINGLQPGTCELITYSWMPLNPAVKGRVRIDFTPPTVDIGGAWSGQHLEGVTYARHIVEVTTGFMGPHIGMEPGGNTVIGAIANGLQLRKLDSDFANYCTALSNSSGGTARMLATGSSSVAANDIVLYASGPPVFQNGLFVYSPDQVQVPLGNGNLCVGNQTLGFVLRLAPGAAGSDAGLLSHALDLTAPPAPVGLVTPGSTWFFSCWYRDNGAQAPFFNFADGLRIAFGP